MAIPRYTLVDKHQPGFYHVVTRCVRRAWLCGSDALSGRNFNHRRAWIEDRAKELAGIFAIDLYAYAVMSNHYHLVLYLAPPRAAQWTDEEVVVRWLTLCPPRPNGEEDNEDREACFRRRRDGILADPDQVAKLRQRLTDLSWFMRFLNEPIARRANREDGSKGRFWEGRFKSQALLDEAALVACMAYVDLNPIRAGIADCPEEAEFTSVKQRMHGIVAAPETPMHVAIGPVAGSGCVEGAPIGLAPVSFSVSEYLHLVDWTGRQLRHDKAGAMPGELQPLLTRMGVRADSWLDTASTFGKRYRLFIGNFRSLRVKARALGQRWVQGIGAARACFA